MSMKTCKELRALVLCPHPDAKGGVAFYYSLVGKYFKSQKISLDYYYTGIQYFTDRPENRVLKTVKDACNVTKLLPRYNLVILNPSVDVKSLIRDGIFHFIAKRVHNKKTLVFFHGSFRHIERSIELHWK